MKYVCQVIINASLEKVIDLFLEKMVINKDLTPGNKCSLDYVIDENHRLQMIETIESVNLPEEIVTIYEVEKVWNRCVNRFNVEKGKVIYTMDVEFVLKMNPESTKITLKRKPKVKWMNSKSTWKA
jgi:hypothetical protein